MHEQIWYVDIEGVKEGPFSIRELKRDARLTPDTLAWRPGFESWVPIKHIPELFWHLFENGKETPEEKREPSKIKAAAKEALAIEFRPKLPQSTVLFLILGLILLALLYFFIFLI